ncbi:MAG: TOBE domain-containing protein [Rhodopila sp.]
MIEAAKDTGASRWTILSALDEYPCLRMRGELRRIQRELGITFVHVTHTQLEATAVATIENQGSYAKITLDTGDGEEFVANVLDEDFYLDPINIGDRAIATWSPTAVRLLADRPGGQMAAVPQPSVVTA